MKRRDNWRKLKPEEQPSVSYVLDDENIDLVYPRLPTKSEERPVTFGSSALNKDRPHVDHVGSPLSLPQSRANAIENSSKKKKRSNFKQSSYKFGLTTGHRIDKRQTKSCTDFQVNKMTSKQKVSSKETESDRLHGNVFCDNTSFHHGLKCDTVTKHKAQEIHKGKTKASGPKPTSFSFPTIFDNSGSLLPNDMNEEKGSDYFQTSIPRQSKNKSQGAIVICERETGSDINDSDSKPTSDDFGLDYDDNNIDSSNEETILKLMLQNEERPKKPNNDTKSRTTGSKCNRQQPFDHQKKQRENSDDIIQSGNKYGTKAVPCKSIFLKRLIGKDPKYVLIELTKSELALQECIGRAKKEHEFLELFLEILAKAYECEIIPNAMIMLHENLKQSDFFDSLSLFLIDLQECIENTEERLKHEKVLKNIISIVDTQITRNPLSLISFTRVYTVLKQIIDEMKDDDERIPDKDMLAKFTILSDRKKRAGKMLKLTSGTKDKMQPPEDFRMIDVTPSCNEIKCAAPPFLRANKINGEYDDLNHYLDVQFRLLREDFVGPLREGISEYLKSNQDKQNKQWKMNSDIRIYNARVYSPVITEHGFCYQLKLEMTPRLRRTNWSVSKRLIYGSLLCLTKDEFSTFILGTVVGRDEKDIKRGLVTIQLDEGINTNDLLHHTLKIAETTAYFESYRHVLKGLQAIQPGEMPFERYIVHCESNVDKPVYISEDTVFDLSPLVDPNAKIFAARRLPDLGVTKLNPGSTYIPESLKKTLEAVKTVNILDNENWPEKEILHLDASQYTAVKTALTKEFSIIQGPPGTGKTYIGLKIAKALLQNRHLWDGSETDSTRKPMLIVCYTNHALDQFLEGICAFFKGDIVRVGGRSKSSCLERCTLKAYRKAYYVKETYVKRRLIAELERHSSDVSLWAKSLELYQNEIVHEDYLFHEMSRRFYNNLIYSNRHKSDLPIIVHWLGITHLIRETKTEIQKTMRQNEMKFVRVDDEYSDRRNVSFKGGRDDPGSMSRSDINLMSIIRKKTIAFFVEDIIIPEDTDIKQMDQELLEDIEFRKALKDRLQAVITNPDVMGQEEANRIANIWTMSFNDRWRLYRMWLGQLCRNIYKKIESKKMDFEAASERYRDYILEEEKEIMQNAIVIGMTTSGAAKYQSTLREIEPKIVIVEEAAEVLEAHVITALSKGCEHLILIGDHKQLKPNPTVYKLAVKYNLNISLFERMLSNGLPFNTLELQHRMRPEIAEIMRHIYPNLKDHGIVQSYPNVKGIHSNLYLIDHSHQEENNEDLRSYSNLHEALFITGLCRYLLQQGYARYQITVLTTYTGQLMCLRKQMPREEFEGVRVTVVDNYQGEENDLVLLSLVRSNQNNKIGFLKTDNRICVALSRAKIGFYLIGNFSQLAANSHLWKAIIGNMRSKGKFGDQLKLYCQNHPNDDAIMAKQGKDFSKAPNGGCSKRCEARLKCGHVCSKFCHVEDAYHLDYKCTKPCQNIICEVHKCPDYCFETCQPCRELVSKVLPKCGHEQMVECSLSPEKFICQMLCEEALPCGHKCTQLCGEPHTEYCKEKVDQELRCGHIISTECYITIDAIECPIPCETILKCGHPCNGTCGKCYCGRFHVQCDKVCRRILVCGHECQDVCNNCKPCTAKCENRCVHSKCMNMCGKLCIPCQEPCEWSCKHFKCTKLCCEPCDRPRCNEPCDKLLECGHPCMGLCGEPCADFFCRECNFETVTEVLFGNEDEPDARFVYLEDCGHNIESNAMDKYIDQKQEEEAVQLKMCPKCKTPIRKCLRYGSVIKESLKQIEMVKQANVSKIAIQQLEEEFTKSIADSKHQRENYTSTVIGLGSHDEERYHEHYGSQFFYLVTQFSLEANVGSLWTKDRIATLRNQRAIFEAIDKATKTIHAKKTEITPDEKELLEFFLMLKQNVLKERDTISEQEVDDFQREIQRGHDYSRFKKIKEAVTVSAKSESVLEQIANVENIMFQHERYTEDLENCVKKEMDVIKKITKIDVLDITCEERLEIVKAMGLSKGHWFKCPNNHIYAIGECGGAMERGKCPECKEEIGGIQHRLTDGNTLAPEMDGATFAAYSEEANNMANFDLDDLH